MKILPLRLDDELDTALEVVCRGLGRDKADVVTDVVRHYVETERLRSALQDPELVALYEQVAVADVALAEEGMADYQRILKATDDA